MGNLDLLEDACARLPHTTRAMFGGHGLFAPNGGMYAGIGDEDRIILKLDDEEAAAEFRELGGEPWTYQGRMTMSRWYVVPDALYDDLGRLEAWAKRAHALAKPARPKKAGAKRAKR
jgi:TfoX/Sxy family transcriptional regulator of competence genes